MVVITSGRKAELTSADGTVFLLRAAVTRVRQLCVIVGNRKAIAMAVKNANVEKRYSGLRQRLAKSY